MDGGTGRRTGLKILYQKWCEGSIPSLSTNLVYIHNHIDFHIPFWVYWTHGAVCNSSIIVLTTAAGYMGQRQRWRAAPDCKSGVIWLGGSSPYWPTNNSLHKVARAISLALIFPDSLTGRAQDFDSWSVSSSLAPGTSLIRDIPFLKIIHWSATCNRACSWLLFANKPLGLHNMFTAGVAGWQLHRSCACNYISPLTKSQVSAATTYTS